MRQLTASRGLLRRVKVPDGDRLLVRLVISAPSRREAAALDLEDDALLVINARNKKDAFGGLTFRVNLLETPEIFGQAPRNEREPADDR